MWRFILITFGFLGFAFYELSGGADYAPREGSRQDMIAKARLLEGQEETTLAKAAPAAKPASKAEAADEPVTIVSEPQVILASAPAQTAKPKLKAVVLSKPVIDAAKAAALTTPAPAPTPEPEAVKDIREVTGNVVNMRRGPGTSFQRVSKLNRGEAVEVLRDEGTGWIKLRVIETGQIGFMADFLLTEPTISETYASN